MVQAYACMGGAAARSCFHVLILLELLLCTRASVDRCVDIIGEQLVERGTSKQGSDEACLHLQRCGEVSRVTSWVQVSKLN